MRKLLARIEMWFRLRAQLQLDEAAYFAIKDKDWEWYDIVRKKRSHNTKRYLELKNKFSL